MLIAFLGPDGSGKTTIIKKLLPELQKRFPDKEIVHRYWRPGILPAPGVLLGLREEIETGVNPDPYGHEKENPFKSLARFLYYLVDFSIGSVIMQLRNKEMIFVYDRYYYDILVDKFRYNFSLPDWIIKAGKIFVKKPDKIFLLIAPVEVLLERKKEIPREALEKNVEKYDKLCSTHNKICMIINTNQAINKIIQFLISNL